MVYASTELDLWLMPDCELSQITSVDPFGYHMSVQFYTDELEATSTGSMQTFDEVTFSHEHKLFWDSRDFKDFCPALTWSLSF